MVLHHSIKLHVCIHLKTFLISFLGNPLSNCMRTGSSGPFKKFVPGLKYPFFSLSCNRYPVWHLCFKAHIWFFRSPPRTRRSSTSSNSSNGGSTYTPSPLNTNPKSNANRTTSNLSPALASNERRSRSPTPRLRKVQNLTAPEPRRPARSRSPTPGDHTRSRSGTPTSHKKKSDKKDQSFVTSNKDLTMHFNDDGSVVPPRSRSPSTGRRSRHNSSSSSRMSADLSRQIGEEVASKAEVLKDKFNEDEVKKLEEVLLTERKSPPAEVSGIDYSPTHRVSDNFRGTSQYHLLNATLPIDDSPQRCPSPAAERGGIDTSPACRVSENFVGTGQYHLLNPSPAKESRHSVSPCRDRGGVDSTPSCRVSENFGRVSHPQATVLIAPKATSPKERSGVDTTPVSKVSENFVSGTRSRKSSASVNDLDLITKKEPNDSGSEVSDEGYKSLGLVTTPPANAHQTAAPLLPGKCNLLCCEFLPLRALR